MESTDPSKPFSIGKLVNMDWKLGLSMSSDACKNLNAAFVAMTIKIEEPSGKVYTKSFEMTLPQFKDFYREMNEMALVMETV